MGEAEQNTLDGEIDHHDEHHKSSNNREVELSPKIQDAIGRSLIAHYDDIVSSAIPDKFLSLLAELEAKELENDK